MPSIEMTTVEYPYEIETLFNHLPAFTAGVEWQCAVNHHAYQFPRDDGGLWCCWPLRIDHHQP